MLRYIPLIIFLTEWVYSLRSVLPDNITTNNHAYTIYNFTCMYKEWRVLKHKYNGFIHFDTLDTIFNTQRGTADTPYLFVYVVYYQAMKFFYYIAS